MRGHKNRIPWSHHDMAQTFSLWGKTMFLRAVRVFITFSSFFFPLCNFASWRMLYIKDMTFGNPALLLCEILWQAPYVLTALSTSVYLFIYLGRNQREHAIQLMRSTVSLHPKKKTGEEMGKEGLESLLLGNLMMGTKMVLQPPSVVAALEHIQWFSDLKAFREHQLINQLRLDSTSKAGIFTHLFSTWVKRAAKWT